MIIDLYQKNEVITKTRQMVNDLKNLRTRKTIYSQNTTHKTLPLFVAGKRDGKIELWTRLYSFYVQCSENEAVHIIYA